MSFKDTVKEAANDVKEGAKDLGKDVENLARDTRDSAKEFWNKPETQQKLKSMESDIRSSRDKVREDFKEEERQKKANEAFDKVQNCVKDSSPEEFDSRADKVSDSLKAINDAPEGANIEVNGDCSVTIDHS